MPATVLARRRLLAALALGPLLLGATRPAAAQRAVLADLESYLNRLDTLAARFRQINPDGRFVTGRVYLQRPGRLRFDYDPPSRIRLIAPGDWRLVFYDASIKQVNVIPLSQTPLGILLDRRVDLSGSVDVTDLRHAQDEVALTVTRKGQADQGSVTLVFGERPIELRRWSVVDPQGLVTHVLLEEVETGGRLDPELFRWRDPAVFGLPD